jgi:hypothetical protein
VFSNRLRVFQNVPRQKLLLAAGGAAVAFVVLQLLPGISKGQETLVQASEGEIFSFLDRHLLALSPGGWTGALAVRSAPVDFLGLAV